MCHTWCFLHFGAILRLRARYTSCALGIRVARSVYELRATKKSIQEPNIHKNVRGICNKKLGFPFKITKLLSTRFKYLRAFATRKSVIFESLVNN